MKVEKIGNSAMKSFYLCVVVLTSLTCCAVAFLIQPSIYSRPHGNKILCQNCRTDYSNSGDAAGHKEPYLRCANQGTLLVIRALLITTTNELCPLQYTSHNPLYTCSSGVYSNQDQTKIVKELCDARSECYFSWDVLAPFQCIKDSFVQDIDFNNQAINITYDCLTQRAQFRPFAKGRYDHKSHRSYMHPIRTLSYNSLINFGLPQGIPLPPPVVQPPVVQPPTPQTNPYNPYRNNAYYQTYGKPAYYGKYGNPANYQTYGNKNNAPQVNASPVITSTPQLASQTPHYSGFMKKAAALAYPNLASK